MKASMYASPNMERKVRDLSLLWGREAKLAINPWASAGLVNRNLFSLFLAETQ